MGTLLLHGIWDLPGPGIEPMSSALAGEFLTTGPPGKSMIFHLHQLLELISVSRTLTERVNFAVNLQ